MAESIRGKPMKTKTFETEAGTPKVKKLVENDIYTGRTHAPGASRDADGLMSKKHAAYEKMIQQPQNRKGDNVEERGASYHNDTSGWVRSPGEDSTTNRPGGFDRGPVHGTRSPTKGAKCTASGADVAKSPFSAASKSWQEK